MSGIAAYILAADPSWLRASLASYYDVVDAVYVCYDKNGRAWTGTKIPVEQCIEEARRMDKDKKIRLIPGDFARMNHSPLDNDTWQRQCAVDEASKEFDWIIQLDTDELLPDAKAFVRRLKDEVPAEFNAVDWPMRTFFHRTPDGHFLEVCGYLGSQISAFPGPVAVRRGARLVQSRQTDTPKFRYDISAKDADPAAGGRIVNKVISPDLAILHLSWIRSDQEIEQKLESWSHSTDFDWRKYLDKTWRRAPGSWRWIYRFHPVIPRWWPALRKVKLKLPEPGELPAGEFPPETISPGKIPPGEMPS